MIVFFGKKLHLDSWDRSACIVIVLAIVLRILLILSGWPDTNSDESTMGLMARHIAYYGGHPSVFYGQDYMGTLEAYLAAGFFHMFGSSMFSLRLSVIVFFTLFLLCFYHLICLLYSKPLAFFSLILLGLGSNEILFKQLEALGGSPDVMLFCTLLLLITSWLSLSKYDLAYPSFKRYFLYGTWGVVAGLGIWSDPLVLPFVGVAVLMLVLFCRQELKPSVLALILCCVLVGLAPEIIYKVTVSPSPYSLALLGSGYYEHTYGPLPGYIHMASNTSSAPPLLVLQVAGTFLASLPFATGGNALCSIPANQAWPVHPDIYIKFCTGIHGVWGTGYLVLWCCAVFLALQSFRNIWLQVSGVLGKMEPDIARQVARLMLLVGSGGTLFLYMLFPQAALTPAASSRYLVGILISIPAVLFPVWRGCTRKLPLAWTKRIVLVSMYTSLFLVCTTYIIGTVTTFTQIPVAQQRNQQQYSLIEYLLRHGATRIYTDYWTCDRIAFQSNERIICSVLDTGLQPGLNRYQPYQALVSLAPHPFYVFPSGSPQDIRFSAKISSLHVLYQRLVVDNYAIYQSKQRIL